MSSYDVFIYGLVFLLCVVGIYFLRRVSRNTHTEKKEVVVIGEVTQCYYRVENEKKDSYIAVRLVEPVFLDGKLYLEEGTENVRIDFSGENTINKYDFFAILIIPCYLIGSKLVAKVCYPIGDKLVAK